MSVSESTHTGNRKGDGDITTWGRVRIPSSAPCACRWLVVGGFLWMSRVLSIGCLGVLLVLGVWGGEGWCFFIVCGCWGWWGSLGLWLVSSGLGCLYVFFRGWIIIERRLLVQVSVQFPRSQFLPIQVSQVDVAFCYLEIQQLLFYGRLKSL